MTKLILDLCGGTGSWSRPYAEAGYEVLVIDTQEWVGGKGATGDVRLVKHLGRRKPHGILAAPPCTDLARSGARWWVGKGEQALLTALSIADACVRIVALHRPAWWALENPIGRLKQFYGPPTFSFDPCDFGDPFTKRTLLWGNFTIPTKTPVEPTLGSLTHKLPDSKGRAIKRSQTPAGFARAFFNANP